MSKKAFDKIAEGLAEALEVARGNAQPHRLHVPAQVDVKGIRSGLKMSQQEFSQTFGFGLAQLRQWEQGRSRPVEALRAYLMLIGADPVRVIDGLHDARLVIVEPPKVMLAARAVNKARKLIKATGAGKVVKKGTIVRTTKGQILGARRQSSATKVHA